MFNYSSIVKELDYIAERINEEKSSSIDFLEGDASNGGKQEDGVTTNVGQSET